MNTLQTTGRAHRRTGKRRQFSESERAEYRKRKREFIHGIAAAIGKLNAVQRAELLTRIGGVATIEGHKLSDYNTIFLWYQRQELGMLSIVGGFQQWHKAGRVIKKGEKGLAMLFPMFSERKDRDGNPIINPLTGEKDILTRFNVGTVFDISQTAPAQPDIEIPQNQLAGYDTIDVESEVVS